MNISQTTHHLIGFCVEQNWRTRVEKQKLKLMLNHNENAHKISRLMLSKMLH